MPCTRGLAPTPLRLALLAVPPVYLWLAYHCETVVRTISANLGDTTGADGAP
jgi:hypothetical protein